MVVKSLINSALFSNVFCIFISTGTLREAQLSLELHQTLEQLDELFGDTSTCQELLATHVANVSGPCEVYYAFLNEFFKGIFGVKAGIWHVVAMQLEVKGKIGREKTSVPRVEKKRVGE